MKRHESSVHCPAFHQHLPGANQGTDFQPLADVNHAALSHAQLRAIEALGGSAFYFLDLDKLADNYQRLNKAFVAEYENSQIAYSFKTNYAPAIGQCLKAKGAWAEVVSAMEYQIARELVGFSSEQIIVNGPVHEFDFIEKILLEGAHFNADAWYLLEMVSEVCKRHPRRHFQIGLRLGYAIAEGGFSRFGLASDTTHLQALLAWEAIHPNCSFSGLHSHFSNSSRSLNSFADRIAGLLAASEALFPHIPPQFINIGGGFFGEMPQSLAAQYAEVPDFAGYAKTIAGAMRRRYQPTDEVRLYLEPGTALIANAMVFASKVLEVKQVDGKTLALVNGSNHNIRHKWANEVLPLQLVKPAPALVSTAGAQPSVQNRFAPDLHAVGEFEVVGNTCIEKDILRCQVEGHVQAGDYLLFQYMGGYTNVLKQPFIHPGQAIYAWQQGQLRLVKRQETMEDLLTSYLSIVD